MLISKNLHKKSIEVSTTTRPTPASLSVIGQVTKYTTVKWNVVQINARVGFSLSSITRISNTYMHLLHSSSPFTGTNDPNKLTR